MKKVLFSLFLSLLMMTQAHASIAVSPLRIEINANKVKANYYTTAIEVRGDSQNVMRFKIYPGYFEMGANSEVKIIDKSDSQYNLSKKIRYVPSEFTVQPGKTQKVRVNIANIKSLPDGESRGILYFEDVNSKEYNIPTGMSGIGAQMIVKTRIGVPIYIDKGNVKKDGRIEVFEVKNTSKGLFYDMKIVSTGNSKIRANGKIQISQGKKLIDEQNINEIIIGGNNQLVLHNKIDTSKLLTGQDYTIRVYFTYKDENGKPQKMIKEITYHNQGKM